MVRSACSDHTEARSRRRPSEVAGNDDVMQRRRWREGEAKAEAPEDSDATTEEVEAARGGGKGGGSRRCGQRETEVVVRWGGGGGRCDGTRGRWRRRRPTTGTA